MSKQFEMPLYAQSSPAAIDNNRWGCWQQHLALYTCSGHSGWTSLNELHPAIDDASVDGGQQFKDNLQNYPESQVSEPGTYGIEQWEFKQFS